MLLLALGLLNLVRDRGQGLLAGGLALILLAGALYMPLPVIAPAYAAVPQPKASLWLLPHKTEAAFGEAIRLRGYSVQATPDRSAVRLTLYWQATGKPDFQTTPPLPHLLDGDGQVVSQQDHSPGEDRDYPPKLWLPQDIVADLHTLSVPAGRGVEGYKYRVGLYNWSTGKQLPAQSPGQSPANFLILDPSAH